MEDDFQYENPETFYKSVNFFFPWPPSTPGWQLTHQSDERCFLFPLFFLSQTFFFDKHIVQRLKLQPISQFSLFQVPKSQNCLLDEYLFVEYTIINSWSVFSIHSESFNSSL